STRGVGSAAYGGGTTSTAGTSAVTTGAAGTTSVRAVSNRTVRNGATSMLPSRCEGRGAVTKASHTATVLASRAARYPGGWHHLVHGGRAGSAGAGTVRENGGMEMRRNDRAPETPPQILVVGQDGMALGGGGDEDSREVPVTEQVEQPAKVMRIGSMIKQLLEEVRAAPLDEASRQRLKEIHSSSVKELEDGLAPELVEEL